MYVGHFAAALAIKARVPRVPTWALLVGVVFLDLWFGLFVLAGIEKVTPTPGIPPGFRLDSIPWSHSLIASLGWSAVYGLCFAKRGRVVALTLAFSVFTHFLLDLVMHPGDLALYPGSTAHFGFGIWTMWPIGWWFFELAFIGVCVFYYAKRAKVEGTFGRHSAWIIVMLMILHIGNSPWLSIMMR